MKSLYNAICDDLKKRIQVLEAQVSHEKEKDNLPVLKRRLLEERRKLDYHKKEEYRVRRLEKKFLK